MKTEINSSKARYVVCQDGHTVWFEERDFEATPRIEATSNVISAWTTKRDAERAVKAIVAERAVTPGKSTTRR